MSLQYLTFDHSEDTDGCGVFDAMASTTAAQVPAVQAEVAQVLQWAHAAFPGQHGPLAEGFVWDHDLHQVAEQHGSTTWFTVSLTISAAPAVCEAFKARLMPE